MNRRSRAGFTLLEITVAVVLLGVVVMKGAMLLDMASKAQQTSTSDMDLEMQARRVLDRVSFAIMGSSRETLFPEAATPIDSAELSYQVSLGFEDGEIAWSDPERIGLSEEGGQVVYDTSLDTPEETRTVWCNLVRPFFGGEDSNGIDDNGNGLVDEKGLSFTLQGNTVRIRLTLERQQPKGPALIKTVETTITVRN